MNTGASGVIDKVEAILASGSQSKRPESTELNDINNLTRLELQLGVISPEAREHDSVVNQFIEVWLYSNMYKYYMIVMIGLVGSTAWLSSSANPPAAVWIVGSVGTATVGSFFLGVSIGLSSPYWHWAVFSIGQFLMAISAGCNRQFKNWKSAAGIAFTLLTAVHA